MLFLHVSMYHALLLFIVFFLSLCCYLTQPHLLHASHIVDKRKLNVIFQERFFVLIRENVVIGLKTFFHHHAMCVYDIKKLFIFYMNSSTT